MGIKLKDWEANNAPCTVCSKSLFRRDASNQASNRLHRIYSPTRWYATSMVEHCTHEDRGLKVYKMHKGCEALFLLNPLAYNHSYLDIMPLP